MSLRYPLTDIWDIGPKIVTLCGSTRFKTEFEEANAVFTHAGYVVLTVGSFPHAQGKGDKEAVWGEEHAALLDGLHKFKITMSDLVFVLNVDGYIGSSTKSEIAYAGELGVPVWYLEG